MRRVHSDLQTVRNRNPQQYKLVHRNSLPNFLADNEFLIDNHRPLTPSIPHIIKSIFQFHTETINIWTHLIGCLASLFLCVHYIISPSYDLPQKLWFLPFFIGSILCLGFSAAFHTFQIYSYSANKWLARLDYCGIVVLIVASFPPWLNYSFYCHPTAKYVYLTAINVIGACCIYFLVDEKFNKAEYRSVKAFLFMGLGLTGVIPGVHIMYLLGFHDTMEYVSWLLIMAVAYLIGGCIYAMRIPERLKPGVFDIWCQSHQILHICVLIGVGCCYAGISKFAAYRQDYICEHTHTSFF